MGWEKGSGALASPIPELEDIHNRIKWANKKALIEDLGRFFLLNSTCRGLGRKNASRSFKNTFVPKDRSPRYSLRLAGNYLIIFARRGKHIFRNNKFPVFLSATRCPVLRKTESLRLKTAQKKIIFEWNTLLTMRWPHTSTTGCGQGHSRVKNDTQNGNSTKLLAALAFTNPQTAQNIKKLNEKWNFQRNSSTNSEREKEEGEKKIISSENTILTRKII